MKSLQLSITFISLMILTACVQVVQAPVERGSALAVSSVWDIPTKYPAGSTFSLSPKYVEDVSLSPEQMKAIYQLYAKSIVEKFSEKEYHFTENNNVADFYIGFAIALSDDLSDKTISEKFGVTPGLQSKDALQKGSFLMYVEDGNSRLRVWRGAVQGFVQEDYNSAERKQRVDSIVMMVLSQFFKVL
jgi:hypothetical protein